VSDNKDFDQKLHDKYDGPGKEVVINWLRTKGFEATENPNRYGIDIIIRKDGEVYGYGEVEVRPSAWVGKVFKFDDLNVPFRKYKKILPLVKASKRSLFFSVNGDYTAMFYCSGKKAIGGNSFRQDTIHMKNEKFLKVKLNDVRYEEL